MEHWPQEFKDGLDGMREKFLASSDADRGAMVRKLPGAMDIEPRPAYMEVLAYYGVTWDEANAMKQYKEAD